MGIHMPDSANQSALVLEKTALRQEISIEKQEEKVKSATTASVSHKVTVKPTVKKHHERRWTKTPVIVQASTTVPVKPPVATPINPAPTSIPPSASSSNIAIALENEIHARINAVRAEYELSTLARDERLVTLARAHSTDMLVNNYFSHENKNGCSSSCRAQSAGYAYWMIGENIYMLNGYALNAPELAAKIVSGWMNSSGHRANILQSGFTNQGIGVAVEGKKVYATELLAKPR